MKARFLYRAYRARYRDESAELAAIRPSVRPDETICDIGANKGSYLYWMSRWAPRGRVVAFEPQERLAAYLREACAALRMDNVEVEAKAVGAEAGTLTLHVPGDGDSPGASLSSQVAAREQCRPVPVPVVSLDGYFEGEGRIGVLKIDVEGAEAKVLEGARRILATHSPLIVMECENRHLESGTVFDVFRHLEELGYAGEFFCGKTLRPLAEFDPEIHQRQSEGRFWEAKDYHNNFLFRRDA